MHDFGVFARKSGLVVFVIFKIDVIERSDRISGIQNVVDAEGDDIRLADVFRLFEAAGLSERRIEFFGRHAAARKVDGFKAAPTGDELSPRVFEHIVPASDAVFRQGFEFARRKAVAHKAHGAENGAKAAIRNSVFERIFGKVVDFFQNKIGIHKAIFLCDVSACAPISIFPFIIAESEAKVNSKKEN